MHLIAIRREDKNPFERRVPLTPQHVRELRQAGGVQVALQPSPRRVFADQEYLAAGASVAESLEASPIILGVKEIPPAKLASCKTYVFFSHTIKGQPQNMPMLRRLLELGCTLIDYEKIVDDQGRRLVFFGRHAGLAGMIDTLWSLGQRLLIEGFETPFSSLNPAHAYGSLDEAKVAIAAAGAALRDQELPEPLQPLIFAVTGYGNVSQGAQEILDLLQPDTLSPAEVLSLSRSAHGTFKSVFAEQDLVAPRAGSFELQDYYDHPERYLPAFSRYLDRISVLVNCIYWEPRYPRLVTLADLRRIYSAGSSPLRVIGDISCDVEGSIQATVRSTEPQNPVFVYDVDRGEALDGFQGNGPVIMAVDNLPAELPREASEFFSSALMPFIEGLAASDLTTSLEQSGLPEPLRKAVIVHRGNLTPGFSYLNQYL